MTADREHTLNIYAYDLGNISGALLFITEEFDLSTKQTEWVATIVVAGSIAGALVAGRLANAIGRKPTMILVAITYAVFAILSGLAQSLVSLDVARFFLGVIIGPYVLSALESLGGTATFAMFAALAVVSFASVWWLAPETKAGDSATGTRRG